LRITRICESSSTLWKLVRLIPIGYSFQIITEFLAIGLPENNLRPLFIIILNNLLCSIKQQNSEYWQNAQTDISAFAHAAANLTLDIRPCWCRSRKKRCIVSLTG